MNNNFILKYLCCCVWPKEAIGSKLAGAVEPALRGDLTALASFVPIALDCRASMLILANLVPGVSHTSISHLVIQGQQQHQRVQVLKKGRKEAVAMPEHPSVLASI
jgi:uncharacterized membrane protein YqgA involved in biofilm formation